MPRFTVAMFACLLVACGSSLPGGTGAGGGSNGPGGGGAGGSGGRAGGSALGGSGGASGRAGSGTGGNGGAAGGFAQGGASGGTAGQGMSGSLGGGGGRAGAGGAALGGAGGGGSGGGGGGGSGAGGAGQGGAGGGGGAGCPPCPDSPRSLPLTGAKHLIADSFRHRIYVTVGGNDQTYPNSLLVVDPDTIAVTATIPLGTEPNVMGLSPDGSRLWVGVDGAFAIRSVDLSSGSPVPGAQYVLPHATNSYVNQTVGAMTFVGGSSTSLMVTLFSNREFDGAVVLDDGVPRGTPSHVPASRIAAGPGNLVFGFNDQSTGFEFYVFTLSPTGFSYTTFNNLVSDFNNDLIYSDADQRVYTNDGDVVNVSDPVNPIRTPGFGTFGSLALLPGALRALMLQGPPAGGSVSLLLLDTTLFVARSSATWPSVTEQTTWDLRLLGSDTVAFLVSDTFQNLPTRLVVVKTALLQ